MLKNGHILDCSAALGIDKSGCCYCKAPWHVSGCPLLLQTDRLQTAREPGKTLNLKRGTLTAQDKHILPCTEAEAGAKPPSMSPSHDWRRRKRSAPYRMGYTQPSCHSEPRVTLGDTATCIWEEGLNPLCLWLL